MECAEPPVAYLENFLDGPDWLSPAIRALVIECGLKAAQTLFRTGARTVGLYEIIKGKVRLVT